MGVLVFQEGAQSYYWLDEVETAGDASTRQTIDPQIRIVGVWIAHDYRRNGIAHRLAQTVAEANFRDLTDFIHSLPFTEDGRRFAEGLAAGRVRVHATGPLIQRDYLRDQA